MGHGPAQLAIGAPNPHTAASGSFDRHALGRAVVEVDYLLNFRFAKDAHRLVTANQADKCLDAISEVLVQGIDVVLSEGKAPLFRARRGLLDQKSAVLVDLIVAVFLGCPVQGRKGFVLNDLRECSSVCRCLELIFIARDSRF